MKRRETWDPGFAAIRARLSGPRADGTLLTRPVIISVSHPVIVNYFRSGIKGEPVTSAISTLISSLLHRGEMFDKSDSEVPRFRNLGWSWK